MSSVLVVLAGQSNAEPITNGTAVPDEWLESGVNAWTFLRPKRSPWQPLRTKKNVSGDRDRIGVDAGIATRLVELGHTGCIIQVAKTNTSMAVDWLPTTGPLYTRLMYELTSAKASTHCPVYTKVLVVWWQGESDVVAGDAAIAAWAGRFASLLAGIHGHATCGPATKAVVVKLNSAYAAGTAQQTINMRAAQDACVTADSGSTIAVDTSAYPLLPDGAHYARAHSYEMGRDIISAAQTAGYLT